MKQFHVVLSGIAILVAGLGASTVWWRVSLDSGQSVAISGTESSAALWSLGAVASASFGLQFTLRGLARRIIAGVQAFFGGFFAVLTLLVATNPLSTAASAIAEVTGVSGRTALAMVSSIELTGWHFSAVMGGRLWHSAEFLEPLRVTGQWRVIVSNVGRPRVLWRTVCQHGIR